MSSDSKLANSWDVRANFSNSLHLLLQEMRNYSDSLPQKVEAMQAIYLSNKPNLYSPEEISYLNYYLQAVLYKFYLANISLEQLWSIGDTSRLTILDALKNGLDELNCTKDDELLYSFALEAFLFQANAFLDFYMLYFCLFLKTGHKGKLSSKDKFYRELTRVKTDPFKEKSQSVKGYFNKRVFGDSSSFPRNDWGKLLRDLRDKIAHRDRLRPSLKSQESLLGGVLFNWPTLQNLTYDRFCQEMQNGMFYLLTDLSPIIYELEWKAGPFRPSLFES